MQPRSPFHRAAKLLLLLVSFSGLVLSAVMRAQTVPASPEVATLLASEDKRFRAQVDHDVPALQETISEDAVLAHVSGYHQSRAQFIEAIVGKRLDYHSIKPRDRVAIISGNLGVVRGFITMDLGERTAENSYLAVYINRDHRWQLLDWQTGAAAPNQGTPARQ